MVQTPIPDAWKLMGLVPAIVSGFDITFNGLALTSVTAALYVEYIWLTQPTPQLSAGWNNRKS